MTQSRQQIRRWKVTHGRKQFAHPDKPRVPWGEGKSIFIDRKYQPRSKYMPHIGDKQMAKASK